MREAMQEGKRYLVEKNGVQFAGTYDGECFISDIDGTRWLVDQLTTITVIRELTGLEAMKVGDVIVDQDDDEAKILAITNNHTAFLRSWWVDLDCASPWYTFKEAEEYGWKLKDQPEDKTELTLEQVADKFNIPVEKLRIKD